MKKIKLILFSIFMILISSASFADVVVSGITSPEEMNGNYTEVGTWAGRPYFERVVGMETYSIFYYSIMGPSGWMIYRGAGQYTGGMWYPGDGHWFLEGTEMFPPESGYILQPVMTMYPVSGTPTVVAAPAIPLSLWGVVAAFLLAGGFLVFRHYKKQSKVA